MPFLIHDTAATAAMAGETPGTVKERKADALLERKTQAKRPAFYKVVLLNDDYTPMDFVVEVLKGIFRKEHADAISLMLEIHQKGSAICGVYTREVAETKVEEVVQLARHNDHPLQCVMEKE